MSREEHVPLSQVTIETVDEAVFNWFDLTVDAHAEFPEQEVRKVPVVWAARERWAMARERKGIRDKNGLLILPIICIRRTTVDPDPSMLALGVETDTIEVSRQVSPRTSDLERLGVERSPGLRREHRPVFEVTSIPFPTRIIASYELVVQAQYTLQMNAILEKLFNQLDLHNSFVAPFENSGRHPEIGTPFEERKGLDQGYVVGFFENPLADAGNLEEFTDQERIVKVTTSFRVPAALQLDPEGERPAIRRRYTSTHLDFGSENVCFFDDLDSLEKFYAQLERSSSLDWYRR
jgi:hypothetical protein